MSCCGKRPPPDTSLDFTHLGCPCSTWAHMKDQFQYLKDERAGVVPCKPEQFAVQWSGIDAMTYLFIVTDKLTGELCEYSVTKEFTQESPLQAFERDYREKELRHNRGVKRAIDDQLEAFEELNPVVNYKLAYNHKGYFIHKPIRQDLGVVLFKVEYGVVTKAIPPVIIPEIDVQLPDLAPEIASALLLLVKRFKKIGVRFERVDYKTFEDLKTIEIVGSSYRNNITDSTVKIVYQEMDLTKPVLGAYHEYYTDKGPQDGYYNC